MIIKEFKLANVKVLIDDEFVAKTDQERLERYEVFNSVGCEIYNSNF